MEEFAAAITRDLRAFAQELLSPGLAGSAVARSTSYVSGSATSHGLVVAVQRLARMVPALLEQVDTREGSAIQEVRSTSHPLRSAPSRRPSDYALGPDQVQLVPVRWLQPTHREEPALAPLRWLLHVVHQLREGLDQHLDRLGKQVHDAGLARAGQSEFAAADQQRLAAMLTPLQQGASLLGAAERLIRSRAGRQLAASSSLPQPYPLAPVWQALRRDLDMFVHPRTALPGLVRSVLANPVDLADLPYLYQRWCGVQVLHAFSALGWSPVGDPVGALFLGGHVALTQTGGAHGTGAHRAERTIDLWVEPRLTAEKAGQVGCRPVGRGEWTPDFVLVTYTRGGRDVFVLDPTLSAAAAADKAKYLTVLAGAEPLQVAGVAVVRQPVRAWACVPSAKGYCDLHDPMGRSGVVPMNPAAWRPEPLAAWVGDLLAFEAAWGVARG